MLWFKFGFKGRNIERHTPVHIIELECNLSLRVGGRLQRCTYLEEN